MWHQKKQVILRLYQLGLRPEQIDEVMFPGEKPQASRVLRDAQPETLPRDRSYAGWNKARYIVATYRMFDRAMRALDVDAPNPFASDPPVKRTGAYHYRGEK